MPDGSNPSLGEIISWTPDADIRWYAWCKKESWRIGEACLLLLGQDPDIPYEWERSRDRDNFRACRPLRIFRELCGVALSALESGTLQALPYDIGDSAPLATRVAPQRFLAWALSKEFLFSIPQELQQLIPNVCNNEIKDEQRPDVVVPLPMVQASVVEGEEGRADRLSRAKALFPTLAGKDRRYVEAWIYREEEGCTVDDLATHLGRSKRTAESYLTEAKRLIKPSS